MSDEKVLNLYAGIGGNRQLWSGVDVTAVEYDSDIAEVYQDRFPSDKVVVDDAHEYLLNHFEEFDFIWSSPPCQTHSKLRKNFALNDTRRNVKPVYPDFTLYEEFVFLKHHFEGNFAIENVDPYYEPLIRPQKVGRHCVWANYNIPGLPDKVNQTIQGYTIEELERQMSVDLSDYMFHNARKDQVLKNCVHPQLGAWVFEHQHKQRGLDEFGM